MIYYIDIDGTICKEVFLPNGKKDYANHEPMKDRIEKVNKMFDEGHEIHYWTARGAVSGVDYTELTTKQLNSWGCKFHELHVGNKPHFDAYICDKSWNSEHWFN